MNGIIDTIRGKYESIRAARLSRKLLAEARERMNDGGKHWTRGTMEEWVNEEKSHCAVGGIRRAVFGDRGDEFSMEYAPISADKFVEATDNGHLNDEELNEFRKTVVTERQYAAYRLALQTLVMKLRDEGQIHPVGREDERLLNMTTGVLESIVIGWNDGRDVKIPQWEDVDAMFRAAASS